MLYYSERNLRILENQIPIPKSQFLNPNCQIPESSPDGTGKQNGVLTVTMVSLAKRPTEALGRLYHCGQDAVFLEGTAGLASSTIHEKCQRNANRVTNQIAPKETLA